MCSPPLIECTDFAERVEGGVLLWGGGSRERRRLVTIYGRLKLEQASTFSAASADHHFETSRQNAG